MFYGRLVQFDLDNDQINSGYADGSKCNATATVSGMMATFNLNGSGVAYVSIVAGLGGSAGGLVAFSSVYLLWRRRRRKSKIMIVWLME